MNDKQKISLPYLPQQGSFQLYFSSHLLPLADESSEVFACLADIFISSFSLSCKSQNNMSFLTPYDIQPFHSTLHVLAEVTYVLLSVSSPINWAVILPSTRLRCLLEFMTLYEVLCVQRSFSSPATYLVIVKYYFTILGYQNRFTTMYDTYLPISSVTIVHF